MIANKADKLSRNQQFQSLGKISTALDLPRERVKVFSAVNRQGREDLLDQVETFLLQQKTAP